MKRRLPVALVGLLVSSLFASLFLAVPAFAAQGHTRRTVMMYLCGSDLETNTGAATHNLHQILGASFSKDEQVRYVVMTGGSEKWQLEASYLAGSEGDPAPTSISSEYNQIWEAKGADAAENPGKLVLLDGDGVSGDGASAKKSEDELMSDPNTLKSFIDYCAEAFPADKYDLILWDHGNGPVMTFGVDQHNDEKAMTLSGLYDAFRDNAVVRDGGRFDFINFDACLMGSVECALTFADYADYYIASPALVPGKGEDYTGWLNELGKDPDADTYQLGRRIVDDFISYYSTGEGKGQKGTIALIDNKKLLASDFVPVLQELACTLEEQATRPTDGEYAFYDELRSASSAINYGNNPYRDLGNLVSLLGVALNEAKLDDSGAVDTRTPYTDLVTRMDEVLDDESIIYARGTENVIAGPELYRKADGTTNYGLLKTSGLHIMFPAPTNIIASIYYLTQVGDTANKLDEGPRKDFLNKHLDTVARYALVGLTGKLVPGPVRDGIARDSIGYDLLSTYKELGLDAGTGTTAWKGLVNDMLERLGGEENVKPWLDSVIRQQASEAVAPSAVSARDVRLREGTGHEVTIANTRQRVVGDVRENVYLELPAVKRYFDKHPEEAEPFKDQAAFPIGSNVGLSTSGFEWDGENMQEFARMYIEWLHGDTSQWQLSVSQDEWYAIKDASGVLHVASVDDSQAPEALTVSVLLSDEGGSQSLGLLAFRRPEGASEGMYRLSELMVLTEAGTTRSVQAEDLVGTFSVMSVQVLSTDYTDDVLPVPISASEFSLSASNCESIELVRVPVVSIPDVADGTGVDELLSRTYAVTDIYSAQTDITEKVLNPTSTATSVTLADVEPAVYNGQELTPRVTLDGKVLVEGKDYALEKVAEDESFVEPGSYEVVLHGKGDLVDSDLKIFTILEQGWVCDELGNWSYLRYGEKVSGWFADPDSGTWYHFGADGTMEVGWLHEDGRWYYLNEIHDGGYGAMLTGWVKPGNHWYWLNPAAGGPKGSMTVGWQFIGGSWYYLYPTSGGPLGACAMNTITPDGYRVDASGRWVG